MYNTVTMPNHVVWRGEVHTIKEKEEKGGRGRGGGGGGGGDSRKGGGGGGGGGDCMTLCNTCVCTCCTSFRGWSLKIDALEAAVLAATNNPEHCLIGSLLNYLTRTYPLDSIRRLQ